VFNGWAGDLAIVKDLESLETLTGGDVSQTLVSDLHTAVELQHRQVLTDRCACTQASNTFVCDPATVGHALHNNALILLTRVSGHCCISWMITL